MNKVICDRCQKEISKRYFNCFLDHEEYAIEVKAWREEDGQPIDLCLDCLRLVIAQAKGWKI